MAHGRSQHALGWVLALVALAGLSAATSSGQVRPSAPTKAAGPTAGIPAATEGRNDFFESLKKRPETVFAYGLRDPAELQKYAQGTNRQTLDYDPVMDAAKFTLLANMNSLQPQLWLPVFVPDKGQTVIIWDWRAGENWTRENGVGGHKMFQVRRRAGRADARGRMRGGGGAIWLEAGTSYLPVSVSRERQRRKPMSDAVAGWTLHSRVRVYAAVGPNTVRRLGGFDVTDEAGTAHYDSDSVGPVHANFASPRDTWTRFMFVIDQRPGDEWAHVWYYAAHERRDPTVILDDVQIGIPSAEDVAGEGRPAHFDFEINSSLERTGPEVACYGRNVVVMRNVPDPARLLRRPVR